MCASVEFQAKYPNLPEELPTLVSAAFGRDATQNDLADFDMSLSEGNFAPEQLHELTCLAVLSSAEMVYQ